MAKTIWITGASSGIGKALAMEYANTGFTLILSARNEDALKEVASSCEAKGAKSFVVPMDLSNANSIQNAFNTVREKVDRINVLVNNGGISQRGTAEETSMETSRKIFEVNFFGAVELTRLVLPWMIEKGGGTVVAMSSIVGKFGFPLRSSYSASKHALHGYFESVYLENHDKGIKTIVICPGRINTNISVNALRADGASHAEYDKGQATGVPAEKAARKMRRAIDAGKKEVWIGGKELGMAYFRKYWPGMFFKIAKKVDPK